MTERIKLLDNGECIGHTFFIQAALFNVTGFADWNIKVIDMDQHYQSFYCERVYNPYGNDLYKDNFKFAIFRPNESDYKTYYDIVLFAIKKELKIKDGSIEDPYERVFGLKGE